MFSIRSLQRRAGDISWAKNLCLGVLHDVVLQSGIQLDLGYNNRQRWWQGCVFRHN